MGVKDRIQQYIDIKGISVYRLEADTEMSKGYWRKTKNISADVLQRISTVYSDISPNWLLTGKGDMLNNCKDQQETNYMTSDVKGSYNNVGDQKMKNSNIDIEVSNESEIKHLKEIITQQSKLIEEKERFIEFLIKNQKR